ncbi:MAG TPA: Gfo/Idh/MocA family oxidoreductase [Verrucomicrobiae bacterium]
MATKKASPVRLGVIGLTHDHVWDNLKDLKSNRDAVLVAVSDEIEPLRERAVKEYGVRAHASAQDLLEGETLDAVLIYGDNAEGEIAAILAADAGLDVLIEKPMAATLAGADEMIATARNAKTRLMVNWPTVWWPQLQQAIKLVEQGAIGRVWQTKYRAAHCGPKEMGASSFFCEWLYDVDRNGGGALIDYCCYGAAMARFFLGVPSRVTAMSGRLCKEDIVVEDNAVLLMQYPGGLSIAEASWTQVGYMSSYFTSIYGTEGTLIVEPGAEGKLMLATEKEPYGKAVKVPKPAPHLRNATAHFVHCLQTGEAFHPLCQDRVARDAQEILEAGLIAAETGNAVSLPLSVG